MIFHETNLKGVYVIKNKIFRDQRGAFIKVFHEDEFKNKGLETEFKESFYSISQKGVIRGMHFQLPPFDHAKLVYVVLGSILDVVVDIRKNSPTYGKYFSVELSDKNAKSIYIPRGFAHGFKVLSDTAIVVYMTTAVHSPQHDKGIRWDSFGFDWKIKNPIISDRDKNFPCLSEFDSPFVYKKTNEHIK